jgi:predicted O-methyltransferase YrrM
MSDNLSKVFTTLRTQYDDKGRWAQIEEGQVLFDAVKSTGAKVFFEIGTANGWTACWAALAGADVYTFDIVDRAKVYNDPEFPLPELKERIHFTTLGSPECIEIMKTIPRNGIVVWFIDGDHSREGVTRDFNAVKPLLQPGDKVIFHDTNKNIIGVYRFWKQMNREYPGQCTGHSTRNGMGTYDV